MANKVNNSSQIPRLATITFIMVHRFSAKHIMKTINKLRETDAVIIYRKYWESYSKGDLEKFASTLDENFEMIGTSESEQCHGKVAGIEFLKGQIDEIVGKVDMRNRQIQTICLDPLVLINEACDLYVLAGSDFSGKRKDWNFYSKIRISTLLRETISGWKVVHQHGSVPDLRVGEGETLGIEKISKENLELRDAVKRRTAELEHKNRELALEATLEKVRTVAMGMKKPEDMLDVCRKIAGQLQDFGISNIRNVQTVIIDEKTGKYLCYQYFPAYDQCTVEDTDYHKSPVEHEMVKQMLASRDGHFIGNLIGEELESFCTHRKEVNQFSDPLLDKALEVGFCFLSIGEGGLGLSLYKRLKPEVLSFFKRFHQVFSLAFQKFQDIQKAELQALEAKKQASLDRVRSEISSMRHADDLHRITPLIFNELNSLGIPFIRCGIFIVQEKEQKVEIYLSTPEGKSLAVMKLPFDANQMTAQSIEAWRKGEIFIQYWNQRDFVKWGKSLQKQGYIKDLKTYQGTKKAPESLNLHFVPFTQGLLYVGSAGNLTEEQIGLIKALTKSFDIAFARYEDFVKLEQAKIEVEKAMTELKSTQSQLIQREKLASLGQLTAGIAHEIKNPLNFVNNFSEVSIEMIDESLKEIEKPKERDETLIREALKEIKSNLVKVLEHGTRANNIVSSMLQHSRGGSGKMELTGLNALVREYVDLSYHGMRAGKNPIKVELLFDLDDRIGEIELIGEDFSRAVINLCNNAFDAMREKVLKTQDTKHKKQDEDADIVQYNPKLQVSTILEKDQVRIYFKDNGTGIPEEIKDKVLQPFFTTKKGTEGTGLGLSITNDIVKAHGGELTIDNKADEGATFIISLPKS